MPLSPTYDEDSESRTSAIGVKRSSGRRQRRGRGQSQGQVNSSSRAESESCIQLHSSSTMGNNLSLPAEGSESQPGTDASFAPSNPTPAPSGLGNNRLATGFPKPRTVLAHDTERASSHNSPSDLQPSPGDSNDNAIEISDDEHEEGEIEEEEVDNEESSDEGGMVINIDSPTSDGLPQVMDVDHDPKAVEGTSASRAGTRETTHSLSSSGRAAHLQLQGDLQRTANRVPDTPPSLSHLDNFTAQAGLRLGDLSTADLERQLKYAFFDIERGNVDLNRAAVCLCCLRDGHIEQNCPEKTCMNCSGSAGSHSSRRCPLIQRCTKCHERGHDDSFCVANWKASNAACELCGAFGHLEDACTRRFFVSDVKVVGGPVRLWISCCVCGSKAHLVGDCPDADKALAARWSLKPFAPEQITNLSLEANTKRLETQAANRGLRPEGLQVRGRAGIHNAGVSLSTSASDDEDDPQFLRPQVRNAGTSNRGNFTFRHPRRFPSPIQMASREDSLNRSNPGDSYRGRPTNGWYATDSFGRRWSRSRSPHSKQNRGARGVDRLDIDRDSQRRSRSPRQSEAHRFSRRHSPSPRRMDASRRTTPRGRGQSASNQVERGLSIELPVRRGSSSNSTQVPSAKAPAVSAPQSSITTPAPAKSAKANKKKPKKGKGNAPTPRS